MPDYKAPLRNVRFLINEVFDYPASYAELGWNDAGPDVIDAILEESARFCEEVLAPLNASGDIEGCHYNDGVVTTPAGFKAAYEQFIAGGWGGLSAPCAYGGQGLPESLSLLMTEMVGASNTSWSMYYCLTHGAIAAIAAHGSEEQKETYLKKLIEGRWTGTMCLTEPHCGSDLGLIKTRAVPRGDGTYDISGTKIFISAGEHDMSDNIVHLVLAKLPGAPSGTRGISLFIVPKFLPEAGGASGARNQVSCGAIEHKMGIRASATCVMNFDGAIGYLIGEPNRGLDCMFTFMNNARLGAGLQGLCLGERSYQGALAYANERLQMRALSGPKNIDKPADPIIVHPDVRRMLLTMKAFNEGNRALGYFTAQLLDRANHTGDQDTRAEAEQLLSFMTPICKAFISETGLEVTNLGMQIYGGHGYIRETGMEQFVRDCRIAPIYEGSNGIQALDLLGRKVMGTQGKSLRLFTKLIHKFCETHADNPRLNAWIEQLSALNQQWGEITQKIGVAAMSNPEEVGAAATDYLMVAGYIAHGYFWLRMAQVAQDRIEAGSTEDDFYLAKLATCEFYFKRLLPRSQAHLACIAAGSETLMGITAEQMAS